MPALGIVVFWIWPLSIALPVYLVILITSGFIYYALMQAMRRPVATGKEGLLGKPVEILDISGHDGHVRVHGEIWQAAFEGSFLKADKGIIKDVQGMTLIIGRASVNHPRSRDIIIKNSH